MNHREEITVWVANTRTNRVYRDYPRHTVSWREPGRVHETFEMDKPTSLADALIWLGTKMKLEGEE